MSQAALVGWMDGRAMVRSFILKLLRKYMQNTPLANQSQFEFRIVGLPDDSFTVQQFSGTLAISHHYHYQIDCVAKQEIDHSEIIGQRAKLILNGAGVDNYIHGLVTASHFLGMSSDDNNYSYQFFLSSNLESLVKRQSSQIFLNKNVSEIVKEILTIANWSPTSFLFKLHQDYSAQKFVMQLNETDLSFIERLLSQAGMFYFFSQNAAEAQLWILDNPDDLPDFSNQSLPFFSESGSVKNSDSIYYLSEEVHALPQQVKVKNRHYQHPEVDLTATSQNQTVIPGIGNVYQYGNAFETLAEGQQLAELTQQALDGQRQFFLIKTDCRVLQLGQIFTLTQHPQTEYNVACRVMNIRMKGNQFAQGEGENTKLTYEATCIITPTTAPLCIFPQVASTFPHVLPATIETMTDDASLPFLDEYGNYHVRFPFDQSNNVSGQASAAIPFLHHHGGALSADQLATGLHFPLRKATQVAVGFIQGNLNLPVILGAIHNSENPSTVAAENNTQNSIRTFAANELTLDDQVTAPYAKLATKDHKNQLVLDATPDQHQISLSSAEGSIKSYAKKTVQIETGDSFIQNTSGSHAINVQNKHSLITKNENINHQSGNNLAINANRHIQMAASTMQIQSGQNTQIAAANNFYHQIENGDLQMETVQGKILIQSNKHVLVHSQGSALTVGQPIGGVVASPNGNLYLSSPNIHFEAEEINIYGNSVNNTQPSNFKYQPPEPIQDNTNDDSDKNDTTNEEEFKLFVATVYAEAGYIHGAWEPVADTIMTRADCLKKNVRNVITASHQFSCYTNPDIIDWNNIPEQTQGENVFWNEHREFLKAWAFLKKININNQPPMNRIEQDLIKQMQVELKPYYNGQVRNKINYYYSPAAQKAEHRKDHDRYKDLPDFLAKLKEPEKYRVYTPQVPEPKFRFYYIPPHAE